MRLARTATSLPAAPAIGSRSDQRGRYFTIPQAVEADPGVLTVRLIRRLVAERRIAFTYSGRRVVLTEADIEEHLDGNRCEQRAAQADVRTMRPSRQAASRPVSRRASAEGSQAANEA